MDNMMSVINDKPSIDDSSKEKSFQFKDNSKENFISSGDNTKKTDPVS